jgi:3-hydroxybutyryl-CoA dehydrogenase
MSDPALAAVPVLVVGAGTMGAGIAQVAAQAGHTVWLHDARAGAAIEARARLATTLRGLVDKGRLAAATAETTLARVQPAAQLADAAAAGLVVEAIVEDLGAKRALLQQLETVVSPQCVLATNTSSISVTALANGLAQPGRLVGMHFFNPAPLMKLVEVVSGLHTQDEVAEAIFQLSLAWGKTPVHARSTPGFIVNRIARPFYAESLALLLEHAVTPAVLDACFRSAGFRMGPCELMDLIGHDTNFAVTSSIFEANFCDRRYQPSLVQREMVEGGLLGRKSGRGFYAYPEGAKGLPVAVHEAPGTAGEVTVHGEGTLAEHLEQTATRALGAQGWGPARVRGSGWTGLEIDGAQLRLTDGRTAAELQAELGLAEVAVFDRPLLLSAAHGQALAFAVAETAEDAWRSKATAWLAALGFAPMPVADTPGLVIARTVAMLINEAADAVQQRVCSPDGADAAMKLGVNYPAGPFEWLARWSPAEVVQVLEALDHHYRGERYRVSPWLRRRIHSPRIPDDH